MADEEHQSKVVGGVARDTREAIDQTRRHVGDPRGKVIVEQKKVKAGDSERRMIYWIKKSPQNVS